MLSRKLMLQTITVAVLGVTALLGKPANAETEAYLCFDNCIQAYSSMSCPGDAIICSFETYYCGYERVAAWCADDS